MPQSHGDERQPTASPGHSRAAVPGTTGYADVLEAFVRATDAIPFNVLHAAFLPYLPVTPAAVLDVGCGVGRDAATLAAAGHQVVAVEPTAEFLARARTRYPDCHVEWLADALPHLACLAPDPALPAPANGAGAAGGLERRFDFILASAVWHHLSPTDQDLALRRVAALLAPGGVLALSLRQGPAGAGSVTYPTSVERTIALGQQLTLSAVRLGDNEASLLPGKPQVTWSRLLLRRP